MFRFSLANLLKFLIGTLLVQGVTALLVVTALKTNLQETRLFFGALGAAIGMLTALWFTSVADNAGRRAVAKAREGFSREKEKIRARAEQEKVKEVQNTHRQLNKEKRRAQMRSNVRTGVMVVGGVVGLGTVMLFSQFMTLGLLTLTTAGGAALGYTVRARQERFGEGRWRLLGGGRRVEVIDVSPPARALKGSPKTQEALREG
jgi:hypothetical protein